MYNYIYFHPNYEDGKVFAIVKILTKSPQVGAFLMVEGGGLMSSASRPPSAFGILFIFVRARTRPHPPY